MRYVIWFINQRGSGKQSDMQQSQIAPLRVCYARKFLNPVPVPERVSPISMTNDTILHRASHLTFLHHERFSPATGSPVVRPGSVQSVRPILPCSPKRMSLLTDEPLQFLLSQQLRIPHKKKRLSSIPQNKPNNPSGTLKIYKDVS